MAAEGRRTTDALADILLDEPYRFEFFQAVRLLERMFPERAPVGYRGTPAGEVVRFRTRASLEFPASQIHTIEGGRDEADDGDAAEFSSNDTDALPEMFVNFMGLTGPLGSLPHHYTELLIERARFKDTAYWEFLDIFNHRLISLFYRAWEKYRFHIAYERGGADHFEPGFERNGKDRFTEYLFDLLGLGTPHLRGRLDVADEGLLFYGGLIAQRPHSASAIAAIIGDHFGVPVQVEQFTGQWLALGEDSLTKLGAANSELGVNTIAGTRVWDTQSKFRLDFGPLSLQEFLLFLPVNPALQAVGKMTRLLAGLEFDFDVQLRLRASEVPASRIGLSTGLPPMLGWTSWLKTEEYAAGDPSLVLASKE